jgi:hypothetical protein
MHRMRRQVLVDPVVRRIADVTEPSTADLANAAAVSARWVTWRERTNIDQYDERFEKLPGTMFTVRRISSLRSRRRAFSTPDAVPVASRSNLRAAVSTSPLSISMPT